MDLINKYPLDKIVEKTLKGDFGTGEDRQEKLDFLYPIIQNLINKKYEYSRRRDETKSIKKLALLLLKGELNEEKTKINLGEEYYSKVAKEKEKGIEDLELEFKIGEKTIDELAMDCIKGLYGNGEEREKILGDKYPLVQKRVNELLDEDSNYIIKYYKNMISLAETILDENEKNESKELERIKKEYKHHFPLIQYIVKVIEPDFPSFPEKEELKQKIAEEVSNGQFWDGEFRKNIIKIFDEDLYKETQEITNDILEKEIKERIKKLKEKRKKK